MSRLDQTFSNMDSRYTMAGTDENTNFSDSTIWKLALLAALAYLVWSDRISINFNPSTRTSTSEFVRPVANSVNASSITAGSIQKAAPAAKPKLSFRTVKQPNGYLSNITLILDPEYGKRNGMDKVSQKAYWDKCKDYVERFSPVAVAEMEKYGIPASITLAQALLESDAGESALAKRTNNQFGIKCISKSCPPDHCVNHRDDSHKDFFRKYGNIWASYRDHSLFLSERKRYSKLFKLDRKDYKAWAKGLQKAGYATDKKYAEKLITVIYNLRLDRYDQEAV